MKPGSHLLRAKMIKHPSRLVVFFIVLATALWLWTRRSQVDASVDQSRSVAARASSTEELSTAPESAPLRITWPVEIRRDPFAWVNEQATKAFEPPSGHDDIEREANEILKVNVIVFAGESSLVTINNRMYRRGDVVAGFLIQRIEHRYILVEKNGVIVQVALHVRE